MKTSIAIISLFIILSIIDFTTTVYAIGNGIGQEGNVLMSKAIENGFYSIVKAGGIVLISLFLAKLSRRHEKAFKVASYFVIAITLLAVINNILIINAGAITVGSNVKVVGGGYPRFYDSGKPEFLYWTSDDGGEIHLVVLNTDGSVSSDTTIVKNVTDVKALCIDKNGYVWFSRGDGIWKRVTKSTNPLDFSTLKDDSNYFIKVTSDTSEILRSQGNRIYYGMLKYIDLSTHSTNTIMTRSSIIFETTNDYIYSIRRDSNSKIYIDVIDHDGNLVQSEYLGWYQKGSLKAKAIFVSSTSVYGFIYTYYSPANNHIKKTFKCELYDNGTVNVSSITHPSWINLLSTSLQESAQIKNYQYAVFVNSQNQAETYVLNSVYDPDNGGGGGGTGTTQYYNVSLYFVNAENNQFLSDAFVTVRVTKGGITQFSLNQIVDNGYTFTAEEGSTVTITYAYRDGYVSEISQTGSAISLILDPFINPFLQFTDHVNITIQFYPTEQNVSVHFIFLDAMTNAQIDNVTLVVKDSGGNEIVNGTFDYSYTLEDAVRGEFYFYNVSKDGYLLYSNRFQVPYGGELKDYYVEVYLVPLLGEEYLTDPVNNTIVEFYVLDSYSYEPLSGAVVTLNGMSKVTNSQGFTYFEVPKNDTYSYVVQRAGYYSKSGVVQVGTETVLETVYLLEMPSATPTTPTIPAGGGGSGGTTGGGTGGISTGYTPDEDLRQAARDTLTQFYQAVPQFFGLIFLLFLMAAMKSVMRR